MMKTLPPILFALALQGVNLSAAEQIVTLGDSLTFAYESEFCFQQTITGLGSIGDGFPATVRNWIEILSNPAYRGDRFELGTRDSVVVDPPLDPPFDFYFRQSHNWAIPGLKVDELRRFMAGEATFSDLVAGSGEFSTLSQILLYSNFSNATDFALTDLENQIQNTAERLTLFIGGNDIHEVYATIYNGGSAGTFVADFTADIVAILDRVHQLNPNIQIVLVNVPHVGITRKVRQEVGNDQVKVERVSAVLRDLNSQLATLAAMRNIGYADIYSATVSMIVGANNLCVQGRAFFNGSTPDGSKQTVWLNGPVSDNFHPNTCGQEVIANVIIGAFNKRYHTGIAPLTATEMLGGLLGYTATEIDMPFATWSTNYGRPGIPVTDDSDGDGIPAGTEFATGLNPTLRDSDNVSSGVAANALELAYPVRLPSSTQYTLAPESAATLTGSFTPFAVLPAPGADGLARAVLPLGPTRGFLRLKATTLP